MGITEFNGFSPDSHHLTNWGFTQGACNYEKQHPTKLDCKLVLFLDAKRGNPYLLRVEGTTEEALLSGQPQSIFHFLHALEANGFFEPDEPIGAAYSI